MATLKQLIAMPSKAVMPCVSKCCWCCSLKYGNLAYGVISLISRVCAITSIFLWANHVVEVDRYDGYTSGDRNELVVLVLSSTGGLIGWLIGTSVALYVALKGIIQKRSILLYPYIVVIIFELVVALIIAIVHAVVVSPWVIIPLFIILGVDVYVAICLISLYQHMKQSEKSRPVVLPNAPIKKV